MHLLPQSFVFQATTPPNGRLAEQRHSSSQPLFDLFEKPAAPPPAAGFFVFGEPQGTFDWPALWRCSVRFVANRDVNEGDAVLL
ncbi:hypothetical protein ASG19_16050 [Rhizobium sp. Leaf306]|jgi:hypothetical protein|nr:hypothetical protein ASG19_16050 [Rhizobium sp. Leaf306]NSY19643.1 hypothetical protein [Neorhizobium sp. AL 9.2.2]